MSESNLKTLSKLKMAGRLRYWRGTIEIPEDELHAICDEIQEEHEQVVTATVTAMAALGTSKVTENSIDKWLREFQLAHGEPMRIGPGELEDLACALHDDIPLGYEASMRLAHWLMLWCATLGIGECEIERKVVHNYGGEGSDTYEFVLSCGHSVEWLDDEPPRHCPTCGKVVGHHTGQGGRTMDDKSSGDNVKICENLLWGFVGALDVAEATDADKEPIVSEYARHIVAMATPKSDYVRQLEQRRDHWLSILVGVYRRFYPHGEYGVPEDPTDMINAAIDAIERERDEWKAKAEDAGTGECEKLPSLTDMECIVRMGDMERHCGYWRCSECGCENFEGARHCMNCGRKGVERWARI